MPSNLHIDRTILADFQADALKAEGERALEDIERQIAQVRRPPDPAPMPTTPASPPDTLGADERAQEGLQPPAATSQPTELPPIEDELRQAGLEDQIPLVQESPLSPPSEQPQVLRLPSLPDVLQQAGLVDRIPFLPRSEAAASPADSQPDATAVPRFSPFDNVFRQYAGDLAENPEFIGIVAAGTRAESGWDTNNRTGDNGHSWGLFQINDLAHPGGAWRNDPDAASAYMVPRYADAYRAAKAQYPNLQGAELASLVAAMAERPLGWDDPTSAARRGYATAYAQITGGAPDLLAQVGQVVGNVGSGIGQTVSDIGTRAHQEADRAGQLLQDAATDRRPTPSAIQIEAQQREEQARRSGDALLNTSRQVLDEGSQPSPSTAQEPNLLQQIGTKLSDAIKSAFGVDLTTSVAPSQRGEEPPAPASNYDLTSAIGEAVMNEAQQRQAATQFAGEHLPQPVSGITRYILGGEQLRNEMRARDPEAFQRADELGSELAALLRSSDPRDRERAQQIADEMNALRPRIAAAMGEPVLPWDFGRIFEAASRNPELAKTELGANLAAGGLAMWLAPTLEAPIGRQIAAAALDPGGQVTQVGLESAGRLAGAVVRSSYGERSLDPVLARLADAEHTGGDLSQAGERRVLGGSDAGVSGGAGRPGEGGDVVPRGSGSGDAGAGRFPYQLRVQQLLDEGRLGYPVAVDDLRTPSGLRSASLYVGTDGSLYAAPSTHADSAIALLREAGAPPETTANIHTARASAHTQAGLVRVATSRDEVAVSVAGPVSDAQLRAIANLNAKNRGGRFRFDIEDAAGTPIRVGESIPELHRELDSRQWRITESVDWGDETFASPAEQQRLRDLAQQGGATGTPGGFVAGAGVAPISRTLLRGALQGGVAGAAQDEENRPRGLLSGALLGAATRGAVEAAPGTGRLLRQVAPSVLRAVDEGIPTADTTAPVPAPHGLNIDLGKYPEEVRQLIQDGYNRATATMDAARRGVISDQQVQDLAQQVGSTVGQIRARWRPGRAENAETILAFREALAAQSERVLRAQNALRAAPQSADALNTLTEALTRHAAVQEVVTGVTAEAGRALRQFRQPVTGQEFALEQLRKIARTTKMGPEELAGQLGDVDLTDPEKVAQLARTLTQYTFGDRLSALWYFNLLSSPVTHIRNVTSNTLTLLTRPLETLGAAGVEAIRAPVQGRARERYAGEVVAEAQGALSALQDGLAGAWRLMRQGYTPGQGATEIAAVTREPFRGPLADLTINVPGRALQAEDFFFRTLNKQASIYQQAYRIASQEGLTGPALAARVAELRANRTLEMLTVAGQEGAYRVFQAQGGFGRDVARLRNQYPVLRYFIPFVQTPVNITKYVLERSPAAVPGALVSLRTGTEAGLVADRVSRATIGSLTFAGLLAYGLGGNLTGRAPRDQAERDAFYRQGKQPYSFRGPDGTWYSYQALQPFSALFAAAAEGANAWRRGDREKLPELATLMSVSVARSLLDMPWTQGMADALEVMHFQYPLSGSKGCESPRTLSRL